MNSALLEKMQLQRPAYRPRFQNWKGFWVEIGGQRFFARSKWESNYARYLQHLKDAGKIQHWVHEPETFWFEGIRRGVTNYKPDFKVMYSDGTVIWIEVKGFFDRKSKLKLKRMRIYHPNVEILVAGEEWFKRHGKALAAKIPGWEK